MDHRKCGSRASDCKAAITQTSTFKDSWIMWTNSVITRDYIRNHDLIHRTVTAMLFSELVQTQNFFFLFTSKISFQNTAIFLFLLTKEEMYLRVVVCAFKIWSIATQTTMQQDRTLSRHKLVKSKPGFELVNNWLTYSVNLCTTL